MKHYDIMRNELAKLDTQRTRLLADMDEHRKLTNALQRLAVSAGVSDGALKPEPRKGVDTAFATICVALSEGGPGLRVTQGVIEDLLENGIER